MNPIVIIGGGHAAAQLCAGLAEAGQASRVHLVCEEACEPYHRPPLSKTFLKSADQAMQPHRPANWFQESGIHLHLAKPVDPEELQALLTEYHPSGA